jgi:hypothetical protein
MRTLSFAQAFDFLSAAAAVKVDQDALVYAELYEPGDEERDDSGLFMLLETPYGTETFAVATHQTVDLDDQGQLILVNTKGQRTLVEPLVSALAVPNPASPTTFVEYLLKV